MVIGALGPAALDRLRAVLRLRRDPVRVLGAGLGRPRPGRDVHPLGGRPRALQLHPGARGDRRRHRLGRGAPPVVGSRGRAARLRWRRDRVRGRARRRSARSSSMRPGRRGATRPSQVAQALDAAGAPPSDRVMSIDAAGTRYWTGHGGVVLVNDPLDTIHDVARAYDIRWLVLDRGDAVAAVAPILDGGPLPAWLGEPILGRGVADAAGRLSRAGDAMTRREAVLSALGIFVVAFVVRVVVAGQIVFPKPEDTAYYVGVARNLLEGRGLVSDALWSYGTPPLEFPRQAFEVWLPLPTFLAAIPMALLGTTFAAAQWSSVLVGAHRAGPRLAAGRRRRRGTRRCRSVAPGPSRSGPGWSTAVYLPLLLHSRTPRLDDAVRGPRPRRLPADGPHRRATRAAPGWPTRGSSGSGVLIGLAGADPQRGGLHRPRLGRSSRGASASSTARLGSGSSPPSRSWPASSSCRGRSATGSAFGSPFPGQAADQRAVASPASTSSPGTTHRPCRATWPSVRRGWSRCASRASATTCSASCSCSACRSRSSACRAAVAGPRRGASARSSSSASVTFLVTSLVFPVATTWGTFLHAAGPVHVLLVLSRAARARRPDRPPRGAAGLDATGRLARPAARDLRVGALLGRAPADVRGGLARHRGRVTRSWPPGWPRSATRSTPAPARSSRNFPIWLAETQRIPALALPDEPPRDVLDLANDPRFGAKLVVLIDADSTHWPCDFDAGVDGADCFRELDLGVDRSTDSDDPLAGVRVFEVVCP